MATEAARKAFDESKVHRDHGKFSHTEGAQGEHKTDQHSPMHERVAPGGDLHERAKASLHDHAFVQQHAERLSRAGDEVRAKYPREDHYTDAVHNEAQQAIHTEAMRIHHEQDTIGGNRHLQAAADRERQWVGARGDSLEAQHAAALARVERDRSWATQLHQRDLDAQSRGFAHTDAEREHHQALRDADSRSRGFADREAEQAHKEAERAKADRAEEDQAIAAGHVSGAAREIGDRYEAAIKEHQRAAEDHADALDKAHGEAADALAALHEYSSDEHEKFTLEHALPGLTEQFGETQSALHDTLGRGEHAGYERESLQRELPVHPDEADLSEGERYHPYGHEGGAHHEGLEYVPHPDQSEHELSDEEHAGQLTAHETWHKKAEAAYNEAVEAHHAEFKRRADAAQAALERLHAHQVAAHEGLKSSSQAATKARNEATKALDRIEPDDLVNHEAFAHHERDYGDNGPEENEHDPQWIVDDHARENYERAGAAAESMISHTGERIDERGFDATDALDPLKESTRSTRDAIKELAKITGRAAKLPTKAKTKKSANRPGPDAGGSVWGMPAPARYKLKLTKLDFLSLVDTPAQETAAIRLVKRKDGDQMDATLHARVVKWPERDGDDPLVYCWAFTCTDADGQPYHDLQGDAITSDFIKVAEAFIKAGGAVDEMHDGEAKSSIAFAYPMDPEIATAMLGEAAGAAVKQAGLMVAIRPTAEQLSKIRSREYTGVSIAGTGIRELVKSTGAKCPSCDKYGDPDDSGNCKSCGKTMKRARRPVRPVRPAKRDRPRLRKQAVLTDVVDGHQHQIDLSDPADGWSDQLTTSYNNAAGADQGHSHAWVYDDSGKITIAQDSGHTHTVDAVVPADVIQQAKLNESGKRCSGCGEMCEQGCRFCPGCGCALDRRDSVPTATSDGDSGSASAVVVISARAPAAISTPSDAGPTVKGENKEPTAMADQNELIALKAENAFLKSLSTLTDAQRVHYERLVAKGVKSDADGFLALSKTQRDGVLAEIAKSDSEVYTSKSTGRVYRMSDPVEIIEAAKQSDAMAETMKRLETEREELQFSKRGDELLAHFAKGVKGNLKSRFIKAIRREFTEPAELAEAERALKQADAAMEQLTKSVGFNPQNEPGDGTDATPVQKFQTGLATFAKGAGKTPVAATADYLKTGEGAQLYAAAFPYSH